MICIFVSVIPMVAEDRLLDWLDETFVKLNPFHSWLLWKELIKVINVSADVDEDDHCHNNKNDQVDFDIFEANVANMFGETIYVKHKCYVRLMRRIDEVGDQSEEEKLNIKTIINKEFPDLCNF